MCDAHLQEALAVARLYESRGSSEDQREAFQW
jgi:hypothetical protein